MFNALTPTLPSRNVIVTSFGTQMQTKDSRKHVGKNQNTLSSNDLLFSKSSKINQFSDAMPLQYRYSRNTTKAQT